MHPSSKLCQAQEKIQLARAAGAELLNVRIIATKAAQIWRLEGISAQKRERRQSTALSRRPAPTLPETPDTPDLEDRHFSENPDRGFAAETPDRAQPLPT
ncbi:hypothetical protein [Sphingobium aquiterrae]|uniref:hypothetical protein n=1 Tax=Sphingobium aquiterrae TaxID=2038656 RepID=UPI003016AE58